MNNTGPLGHMINSLQTNLPGCLQGTALGSLGVTKMNETALLPQNRQVPGKTYWALSHKTKQYVVSARLIGVSAVLE